jgi:hypothetical protein
LRERFLGDIAAHRRLAEGTYLEQRGAAAKSREDGIARATVPYAYEGCFAVEKPGMVPTVFYPGRAITGTSDDRDER